MQQSLIIIVLVLLIGTAAMTLLLDARQRRVDRQVALAMRAETEQRGTRPSVRRAQAARRELLLHRMANYKPGITYTVRPAFVLATAVGVAILILYANSLLGFAPVPVFVTAIVVAVMVTRGLFGWQRRRLANKLFQQLPDTIEMVTSAVRSGLPVNEAFRTISHEMPQPTAEQFSMVCSELSLGKSLEEAMEGVYARTQVPEYGFFAVTLAVQMRAGGGLVETLQTLGDTVRQRVMLARRAKALAGEVIFSSRALSIAPLAIGAFLYAVNPRLVDLLFYDPLGRKLLAYAVTSVLAGTLVIHWMVRRNTTL